MLGRSYKATPTTVYKQIYLASQSPRRQQLLKQLGVSYELLLPDPSEDAESLESLIPGERAQDYVMRVTQLKLDAAIQRQAQRKLPDLPILCADTTVALLAEDMAAPHDLILGKADDAAHAQQILEQLSGRTHWVYTAMALGTSSQRALQVSASQVTFMDLSHAHIKAYLASGEYVGKAGAYGIQGLAGSFVTEIKGSYSGIMGLCVHQCAQLLDHFKISYALRQYG